MKKEKALEGQASFKLNGHPQSTFDKDRSIYGSDIEFKEVFFSLFQKKPREPKLNIYKHENKWKTSSPNKSGLYGYFSPFPAYKEDPPKEKTRIEQR